MGDLVLVTGASGYIATHVVQQLIQAGYKVRGTVRSLKNEAKVKPIRDLGAGGDLELVEADLLEPSGWPKAVQGAKYVMHVASPFPDDTPSDENELIKPAVEGTLNVLKACHAAGSVKRVVLTSSGAAVIGNFKSYKNGQKFSEEDWTDPTKKDVPAYYKSKALAERAAWDYVKELPEGEKFELAVVNPVAVMGPALCGTPGTSMKIIQQLMERQMPMLVRFNMQYVDVRDVAAAHLAAMTNPAAAGNRHLLSNVNLWMSELAEILKKEFQPQGYNPPTRVAPYFLLWIVARFNGTLRMILPMEGQEYFIDNTRFTQVLNIKPRPVQETILDMVYNMIESGHIKKMPDYKPRQTLM